MPVPWAIGLSVVGLAALAVGAESLVHGASSLARRLGVSPLVVGLTVVAFGTSAPELVVSGLASWRGQGAIAAGNVIGSNIANVGLILALAGLVRPIAAHVRVIRFDIPVLLGVSVAAFALAADGRVGRLEGALLLAGFVAWLGWTLRVAARERSAPAAEEFDHGVPQATRSWVRDAALVLAGLALLAGGAEALVRGATAVARAAGVSEAIIGLTLVAIGTSLPELATSVAAARRGQSDLALGNVVGSNLFNLLFILGAAATLRPLDLGGVSSTDLAVMTLAAAALLPAASTGMKISRAECGFLLAGYLAYLAALSYAG